MTITVLEGDCRDLMPGLRAAATADRNATGIEKNPVRARLLREALAVPAGGGA